MVNLEKWEVVEHEDVKLGDDLKIVWVEKTPGLKTREVHKGKVSRLRNGEFWLAGSDTSWVSGDDEEEHTTVYRRRAKGFVFSDKVGAVVVGYSKRNDGFAGRKTIFVNAGGYFWHTPGGGNFTVDGIKERFEGFIGISEGVTL